MGKYPAACSGIKSFFVKIILHENDLLHDLKVVVSYAFTLQVLFVLKYPVF